jgi:hypothetical protein
MATNINMVIGNATLYYGSFDVSNIDTLLSGLTDDNKLGLGKDSVKFTAKPKITDYDYAGKEDRKVKNMEEITGWEVKVEGDCLDFNEKALKASLMKKDATNKSTTYDLYVPYPELNNDCYGDVLVVGRLKNNDKPIAIIVFNAYNSDGIQFECKDKNNSAVKLAFEGSYSMENPNDTPFRIIVPKVAGLFDDTTAE